MVLFEALLLAGVRVSDVEARERDTLARQLDPHTVRVIAGWIIRRTWPRLDLVARHER
jgi:hypothetical protein